MTARLLQLLKDDIERYAKEVECTAVNIDTQLELEVISLATESGLSELTDEDVEFLEAALADTPIPSFIQEQVDAAWRSGRHMIAALGSFSGTSISGVEVAIQFRKTDGQITDDDHQKAASAIAKFREDLRKASQRKR